MERKKEQDNRHSPITIMLFGAVLAYAVIVSIFYIQFATMMKSPSLANPPIKFIVGNPKQVNLTGLINVPLNQTFCPENSTIINESNTYNSYLYYTHVNPGQEFKYSFIYNNSKSINPLNSSGNPISVIVLPPFKLVSFTNRLQTRQDCVGYPHALANATITIQAPNSSYFGGINILMYFGQK